MRRLGLYLISALTFFLVLLTVPLVPPHTPTAFANEYSVPSTYYLVEITHEVSVRPGGKELYVASIHSPLVMVVDIDSPDYPILSGIRLPGGEVIGHPDIVFSNDGRYTYMARHHNDQYIASWGLEDANYIVVIDCMKREIDHIIPTLITDWS